ncbi:hypothetical protein C7459_104233 [Tumebacillus permanentifrigoris]|uniref:Uncharacterized protein n=2 Tax=Tumebacillus permanentifrigoris TaxID=378543 RepID=A0A316DCL6_9BACL|nr:hypothetical protein C7459_104233 [Tumebacillus permanentifrigoris]
MHLSKAKKITIIVLSLFLIFGGYVWNYKLSITRVQNSVQADNNMQKETFYKNNLMYKDMSNLVREFVPEEEFDKWSTWKDVDRSFAKVSRPAHSEADYVFQIPLKFGLAHVYYDLGISGLKLRYVDVQP